jgi:cytoskeletal protein RodZ
MLVGELLKKKREESGRELKEIAETLKIRLDYLKAIEEGDLKKLPAEVYLKGYLIEYAKVLNIDHEMIMETYHKEAETPPSGSEQVQEISPIRQKRNPLGYLLIAGSVIALIVVIALVWSPGDEKKTVAPTTAMMDASRTEQETREDISQADNTPVQHAAEGESADTGFPPTPPPAPENHHYDLEIIASDTTWLFITIDSSDSEEMLLNSGESVTRRALNSFALKIGNAGGIRLLLNGKELPRLGEKGQVVSITLPEEST